MNSQKQDAGEQQEAGLVKETFQAVDRYWFSYGSATPIGLFRICIGTLAVADLLMLIPDWTTWFSEKGFVPSWLNDIFLGSRVPVGFGTPWSVPRISLLSGVTDARIGMAFFALTILAGVFTAFGLWTRVSSIALAIGMVSIQHRDAAILHGGDTVVRVGCMYLAIAPSGAACSIDRLIGLWRRKISEAPVLVSLWPQRLITFNLALIYLTTTWLKWGGGMWQNGTATYYPARLPEFYRFPYPQFINDFPFVYLTTYGTLFVEFSMATLVFFKPLRKYVLLCGILMHAHIEYTMNIPLFSYLMVSYYICFYDGDEIAAWAGRIGERKRKWHVMVRMPVGMRLKPAAVGLLDSVDPFKLVHYLPGDSADWAATRHDDSPLPVSQAIWTRSVGSWVFGWFPGVWKKILQNAIEPMPDEDEPAPRINKERKHIKAGG